MFDVEVFLKEIAVETVTGEEDAILAGPDDQGNVWSNNFYLTKAIRRGSTRSFRGTATRTTGGSRRTARSPRRSTAMS
jgi:hypothetical protein